MRALGNAFQSAAECSYRERPRQGCWIQRRILHTLPVNPACKHPQRMVKIQNQIEPNLKQDKLTGFPTNSGLQASLKWQRFECGTISSRQFLSSPISHSKPQCSIQTARAVWTNQSLTGSAQNKSTNGHLVSRSYQNHRGEASTVFKNGTPQHAEPLRKRSERSAFEATKRILETAALATERHANHRR